MLADEMLNSRSTRSCRANEIFNPVQFREVKKLIKLIAEAADRAKTLCRCIVFYHSPKLTFEMAALTR